MNPLIISLLLAFLFIMAYLFVSKIRNSKKLGGSSLPELLQSIGRSSKTIGKEKPALFLTTKELSEHHSSGGPDASANRKHREG